MTQTFIGVYLDSLYEEEFDGPSTLESTLARVQVWNSLARSAWGDDVVVEAASVSVVV